MATINCTHRGAAAKLPENTIAAFKRGLVEGAEAIELDVRLCKTGELVVIHDENLQRVASLATKIADQTLGDLHAIDLGNNQRIETLETVLHALPLQAFPTTPAHVLIDLKGNAPSLASKTAMVLEKVCSSSAYVLDDFALISTNWRQWLHLRRLRLDGSLVQTGISVGTRMPRWLQTWGIIWIAKFCHANMIEPEQSITSARLVRLAHRASLPVHVWTVNEPVEMERLIGYGVDTIMTDYPNRLSAVLKRA